MQSESICHFFTLNDAVCFVGKLIIAHCTKKELTYLLKNEERAPIVP